MTHAAIGAPIPDLTDDELRSELLVWTGRENAGTCRQIELLTEFDRRQTIATADCMTTTQWASFELGLTPAETYPRLRVGRMMRRCPKLAARFRAGALSYSVMRAVTPVVTAETEDDWLELCESATASQVSRYAEHVRRMQRREGEVPEDTGREEYRAWSDSQGAYHGELRIGPLDGAVIDQALDAAIRDMTIPGTTDDGAGVRVGVGEAPMTYADARAQALAHICRTYLEGGTPPRRTSDRYLVGITITLDELLDARRDNGTSAGITGGPGIRAETVRRLLCDGAHYGIVTDASGTPLSVGRKRRSATTAIDRALRHRDPTCRWPGCDHTRWLQNHHTFNEWAAGGHTEVGNLARFCHRHHKALHEGGYRLHRTSRHHWQIHRPDGTPLCPGPIPIDPDGGGLADSLHYDGVHVTEETTRNDWDGQPLTRYAVDTLDGHFLRARTPRRHRRDTPGP